MTSKAFKQLSIRTASCVHGAYLPIEIEDIILKYITHCEKSIYRLASSKRYLKYIQFGQKWSSGCSIANYQSPHIIFLKSIQVYKDECNEHSPYDPLSAPHDHIFTPKQIKFHEKYREKALLHNVPYLTLGGIIDFTRLKIYEY